jgi:hypothetical protein
MVANYEGVRDQSGLKCEAGKAVLIFRLQPV